VGRGQRSPRAAGREAGHAPSRPISTAGPAPPSLLTQPQSFASSLRPHSSRQPAGAISCPARLHATHCSPPSTSGPRSCSSLQSPPRPPALTAPPPDQLVYQLSRMRADPDRQVRVERPHRPHPAGRPRHLRPVLVPHWPTGPPGSLPRPSGTYLTLTQWPRYGIPWPAPRAMQCSRPSPPALTPRLPG
jgi:hypothetical protein